MGLTILYSIGCPKCNVLKKKLDAKGIDYVVIDDIGAIKALNIDVLPVLKVGQEYKEFSSAVAWANSYTQGGVMVG